MNLCTSLIFKFFNVVFVIIFALVLSNDVFSQTIDSADSKQLIISEIVITGNHRTRHKIILRELVFKKSDTILFRNSEAIYLRSKQNLINTSLFNFVTIHDTTINTKTVVLIDVKERWYIWPQVIFEVQDRNFNQWWINKDLFRINYGAALDFNNFTGNKDVLSFIVRLGYSERFGFKYAIPYINKKQTVGVGVSLLLNRNNEINYKTENNKLLFYRDYNNYVRQDAELKVGVTYRKNLYQKHSVEALYNRVSINDSIKRVNPNYFNDKQSEIQYISLQYKYILDLRDNKPYPLNGFYGQMDVINNGIGVFKNEVVDNNVCVLNGRYYTALSKRWFTAFSLKTRFTSFNSVTYYFNKALGYSEDFVRGYEYYVVDGQNYNLGKAAIKYNLVNPRVINLQKIKRLKKFNQIPFAIYITGYADGAYVNDIYFASTNNLNNNLLFGYGVGVDVVTYYDNVIRFEYSFNKKMENGFFLHFTSGL